LNRQWTGSFPPPAQDDILRQAIDNLHTDFRVLPTVIQWNGLSDLTPVRYIFGTRFASSNSTIQLLLQITVTHPVTGRTLSHLQRHIDLIGNQTTQTVTGELHAITRAKVAGTFIVVAQVYLLPSDEEGNQILLESHGPIEVQIVQSVS
jgi:hypothetical protein